MNQSLKTLILLLLSQLLFAQKCIIIETASSKGLIFQNENSPKDGGDFIPNKKEVLAFEKKLQEGIKQIIAGDTIALSIPKHILNLDFSKYYRKYTGLDLNRKNTRIFVTFIPKDKIENICDGETWIKLIDLKERFTISYYLESQTIFCHVKPK